MNKDENRVLSQDKTHFSGNLRLTSKFSIGIFEETFILKVKNLFSDTKIIPVSFDSNFDVTFPRGTYKWLLRKGTRTVCKVWGRGNPQPNTSKIVDGKVMIKGVGLFNTNCFVEVKF